MIFPSVRLRSLTAIRDPRSTAESVSKEGQIPVARLHLIYFRGLQCLNLYHPVAEFVSIQIGKYNLIFLTAVLPLEG